MLAVYPVLLGTGKRFFAEGTPAHAFELVSTQAFPSGIIFTTYKAAGPLDDRLARASTTRPTTRTPSSMSASGPRRSRRPARRARPARRSGMRRPSTADAGVAAARRRRRPRRSRPAATRRDAGRPTRRPAGRWAGARRARRAGVAAAAIDRAHPAQMVVEVAARQEVGERELLDAGRSAVAGLLRRPRRSTRRVGRDEPAEPQPRGQGLARGSGVEHSLGGEPLDRPDRLPVEAVLGVVVVLEDEPSPVRRPGDERGRAARRQDTADRELVGRRDDDRVGIGAGEHRRRRCRPRRRGWPRPPARGAAATAGRVALARVLDRDAAARRVSRDDLEREAAAPGRSRCR